jgi:hypothetical protein
VSQKEESGERWGGMLEKIKNAEDKIPIVEIDA